MLLSTLTTHSPEETEQAAMRFAERLQPGMFIALSGDLGAGKTVFVRGIARGLGIMRDVLSPTFTLMRQYDGGRMPLYHFDVYRLGSEEELDDAGFYDPAMADGVVVCEWAERFREALPDDRFEITIEAAGPEVRTISIGGGPDAAG